MKKLSFTLFLLCLFIAALTSCEDANEDGGRTAIPFSVTNTRGNTNGNTANLGLAAIQGDWIIYSDMGKSNLLKATSDGGRHSLTFMETLNDSFACLNLIGQRVDYISSYYADINTADLTDETAQPLRSGRSYCILTVSDTLYFIDESGDGGIYRVDREFMSAAKRIGTHPAYVEGVTDSQNHASFSVDGGYLYYCAADDGMRICRVDLETNEETLISDAGAAMLIVENGKIYYLDKSDRGLDLLNDDGSAARIVSARVGTFNLDENYIFYTDLSQDGSPVYRVDVNSGEIERIGGVSNTVYLYVLGDHLMFYCVDPVSGGESLYFSDLDGGNMHPAA